MYKHLTRNELDLDKIHESVADLLLPMKNPEFMEEGKAQWRIMANRTE